MSETVVGVDVGGTKIAAALVAADGTIVATAQRPTLAYSDIDRRDGTSVPNPAATMAGQVDAVLSDLLADRGLTAPLRVGIGSAGPIDAAAGTVSPVNIPGWRGFDLRGRVAEAVRQATGVAPEHVELAGDGPCIALGEQWVGAARGTADVIGVICSTGVGGGVVVGGRIYPGETGNATVFGHTSVDFNGPQCPCGCYGCVEIYASGPAMARRGRELGWVGDDAVALTRDAAQGDPRAKQAVEEGMRALGASLAGLATDFDIATVVVGGGVAKAGETVFEPLRRHFDQFITMRHLVGRARVLRAELDNAGLLGAAKLVLD